ncbi:MAG: RNA-binding transcriptional accessory protein, partial [Sedimentisphaerales bacterium]|nr:RNA-binding transcriptional accessory protein [Sedimentisphaerales bacterium]
MDEKHIVRIVSETGMNARGVMAVAQLLEEGSTIPFIARYRKEATGSLDEVQVQTIRDLLNQFTELDKRRESILESIASQGKLTDELKAKIEAAQIMSVLEDLYLPYKPKRRTRATIAKEKGLEPLAQLILEQGDIDPMVEAEKYLNAEEGDKAVPDVVSALAGARDIIAEQISEDMTAREHLRQLYHEAGQFVSKVASGKEEDQEAAKFKDYFDWTEPVMSAPSHRVLAMRRGANEKYLSLRVAVPDEEAVALLEKLFVKADNACGVQVRLAVIDCFKRLLSLSMETEIRLETKKKADEVAIKVFADNIRQLLMAAPLGQMPVLALDPGFRTGCKLVCLDAQGKLLYNEA